ncbi:hypothetical protein BT69DRAFT_1285987, partial [Atractiella rhizophila]
MASMTSIQVTPVQTQSKPINRLPYSSKSEQKKPATSAQRRFHRVRQGRGQNLEGAGAEIGAKKISEGSTTCERGPCCSIL